MSTMPGLFQTIMSDQIGMQMPSQAFLDLCLAFWLSGSWSWVNWGKAQLALERFENGKEVGRYDLFVFGGDNVQFGRRG